MTTDTDHLLADLASEIALLDAGIIEILRQLVAERRAREDARAALDAARAVVEAVRLFVGRETTLLPIEKRDVRAFGALLETLHAYDHMTKARQT